MSSTTPGPHEPREDRRLRPSLPVVLGWSVIGLSATGLAGWLVLDTAGHALAVALAVACMVATTPFLVQLVTPWSVTWQLDDAALVVRRPWGRRVVPWSRVRLARVVRVAGDQALELHLEPEGADAVAGATEVAERCTVRLPIGAEVAVLHRVLASRLGPVAGAAEATTDVVCDDGARGPESSRRQ